MLLTTSTNFLRNSYFVLILSVFFFYQKDESFGNAKNMSENQIIFQKINKEKSLQNHIRVGFSKYRFMRLQQSTNDIRQL